jgi:NAD(P)H-flavin reductase
VNHTPGLRGEAALDTKLLKESFALVAPQAEELAAFFYAEVFYRGGTEVTDMFPPAMTAQRDRLLAALVRIVTDVDDLDRLSGFLTGLGRDHRKFDVKPEHYDVVGQALLATLAHFAGEAWTPEVRETWAAAYALIAQVMRSGAEAAGDSPPWWEAVVTEREMRGPDIAVIRARLSQPMSYAPGQSVAVQFPERAPRVWRFYSPANAPDDSGALTFHVKVEDGGMLSTALALHAGPGARLRLGPPVGNLKLDTSSGRDVLLIAGSTGLAPLQAILEEISSWPRTPAVNLFFGARAPENLYELDRLEKLAAQHDWLTVVHAVTADPGETPGYAGRHGSIVDVAAGQGDWRERDAYVCGSSPMVRAAKGRLTALGMPGEQVHTEDFGWEG